MIRVDEVSFRYRGAKSLALDKLTLHVEPGSIFTLLGPNGAGKTTLIRILCGLIKPRSGCVRVCDCDPARSNTRTRAAVGLVLGDERSFYFRLSGYRNLEFFGGLAGIERQRLKNRIHDVLCLLNLEQSARVPYMNYSTGMRRRLSLARALLGDPPVFLLDEPNGGVDPASAANIRNVITSLRARGKTVLLTTHSMHEAEKLSDSIGFLKGGKLIKVGSLDSFRSLISHRCLSVEFVQETAGAINAIEILCFRIAEDFRDTISHVVGQRLDVSFNGDTDIVRLLRLIVDSQLPVRQFVMKEPSLEEAFLKLSEETNV